MSNTDDNKPQKRLALVGNPNVGKSVLFNHLSGGYAIVSNYPGTTVAVTSGQASIGGMSYEVIDTPGVNSLIPRSEDEQTTRALLVGEPPDAVIQVADAKNLRRALILTLELIELGIPLVLCLNMMDEAQNRGHRIDTARLSALLGIPVVETIAVSGAGVQELKRAVRIAAVSSVASPFSSEIQAALNVMRKTVQAELPLGIWTGALAGGAAFRAVVRRRLNAEIAERLERAAEQERTRFVRPPSIALFDARRVLAEQFLGEVWSQETGEPRGWLGQWGRWAMRPWPGYLIAVFVLWALYEGVGVFAAGVVADFLQNVVFARYLTPAVSHVCGILLPWESLRGLIVGPYGLFTMGVSYAFALVLPIVTAFFFFFGVLEDSGYLPRLSVMMDRLLRLIGLNGKAVLPVILGLGCGSMATLTTRILDTRRERILVTLILTLGIPCSAQLGVVLGMLGGLSWKAAAVWVITLGTVLAVTGWVASRVIPGAASSFLMEIPPLRIPQLKNLMKKTGSRIAWYLEEAVPLFLLGTFVLYALDRSGLLRWIETLSRPLVTGWLGLPAEATPAFLIGFLRRDFGAAGLYALNQKGMLSPVQIVVSLVTVTLFVPCFAQFLVMVKERGLRTALVIMALVTGIALFAGGALRFALQLFPVI